MRLILVRHGETDWNTERRLQGHAAIPLSDRGRRQAASLARRLAGQSIDACYTSDIRRALDTATIIGETLGVKAKPDPRLREMAFGLLEGLTFDEAQTRYPEMMAAWTKDRNIPLPGGEAFNQFSARISAFLDKLKQTQQETTLLLITHAGPIREIIRLALGLPAEGHWYFQVDNASLSELSLADDQPVLACLNDTHHLGEGVR